VKKRGIFSIEKKYGAFNRGTLVICTFRSSQFFERLSMHFGVVDHIRASALTTADRRPPSWNRITDSTHALPVGNGIGEPHLSTTFFFWQEYVYGCSWEKTIYKVGHKAWLIPR
jgi:hypothetical protein